MSIETKAQAPTMIDLGIRFAELKDNFALFDNWEDRYRYLIDLGRKLPPFPAAMQIEEYKVKGCMSQVWLVPGTTSAGAFAFAADSDAHIVKGLIAVLASLFSGQRPDVVADLDAEAAMRELELDQHLSPSRRNGLVAMVQRIKQFAAARRQD